MRRHAQQSPAGPVTEDASKTVKLERASHSDWGTLSRLLPYFWQYRWRVALAMGFLVGAKVANVGVPLLLKELVDGLTIPAGSPVVALVVPLGMLLAYGGLRLCTSMFTELRELIFAKATEGTSRSISLQVFRHLHSLSLRFHLERQTGGMTRDIERGTRAVNALISYSLYSIFPTVIEVGMVLGLLAWKFDVWFAGITVTALVVYVTFTIRVTEWRTQFRRQMNEMDSVAHARAVGFWLRVRAAPLYVGEAIGNTSEALVKYFTNHASSGLRRSLGGCVGVQ